MAHDAEAQLHEDLASPSDQWIAPVTGPSMAARLVAEGFGTLALVAVGLAAATFGAPTNQGSSWIVGFGFGMTVMVLIVAVGGISGAHFNPAVTLGLWAAGRFPGRDIAPYILSQVVGAILGGGLVRLMIGLSPVSPSGADGMGALSIGWGDHSPWGADLAPALIAELLATAGLVATILAATSVRADARLAPFVIGVALMLLIIVTIPLTNAALNPARATGTAVWAGGWALGQLWAWWLAPIVGGVLAGLGFRAFGPADDLEQGAASKA